MRGEVVDVRDHARLDKAFDDAVKAHGRLDVVFANAGVDSGPGFVGGWVGGTRPRTPEGALENYDDERWQRVIDINLTGVFATMRAAARHHEAAALGQDYCDHFARRGEVRSGDRLGLHGRESRRGALHA